MKKIFPLLLAPLLLLSGCAQKETSSAQNNTVGDMTIALDTLGETPAFADGTIDGQPMPGHRRPRFGWHGSPFV